MCRCKCCDRRLSDMEMVSTFTVEDENGNELEIQDDICFLCRVASEETYGYYNREYPFEDLTSGITVSKGFSDNY